MKRLFNNVSHRGLLPLMAVFLCLIGSTGQAWAGTGKLYLFGEAGAGTGQGLVYASKSNTAPTDDKYKFSSTSEEQTVANSSGSAPKDFYGWAKPARGYLFNGWTITSEILATGSKTQAGTSIKTSPATGSADVFSISGGRTTNAGCRTNAKWKADNSAEVTYAQTAGGSYTVTYGYYKVKNIGTNDASFEKKTIPYTVSPSSGAVKPSDDLGNKSYGNDVITLSTTAVNLIRWEEEVVATGVRTPLIPTVSGGTRSYVYKVTTMDKHVIIHAIFKSATLGEISGDKQINVDNLTTVYNKTLTVPVTDIIGDWSASDFSVVFKNQSGPATITPGSAQYTAGLLTIPFTYQANDEGNTTVDVVVSTPYGAETSCQIVATAEVTVSHEAQILLSGQTEPSAENTGSLAAMLTKANGMSGDFTLMLMNPVDITEPLSFTNSFTFDINGKAITSSGNAAISIDLAGADVRFVDGSFTKTGTITTRNSYDGVVSAVRFTAAGQLTLEGGTFVAENTSSAASAKAHTISISNGSVFYMTAGSYGSVSAIAQNEAIAIHVATTADYATMNGGVIETQANTNAYGVWSAGSTNVTGATINVETLTGTNAYGMYVNGSATTLTNTTVNATAKTTQAYGAFVKIGRLNFNGGAIVAEANSDVYGIHIAAGATASVMMRADISANATTAGNARGLNNLGTLIANNANVHVAAATTGATAVNSETSAVSTTIDGGSYEATAGAGTVYGLHHQFGALAVDGGEFHGIATGGSAAYGARTAANGTIKNATLWGETQGVAHTAYGYVAGVAGKSTTLNKCIIKGESNAATAYAIYSRAIVEAIDCELIATANNGNKAAAFWAENGTNTITRCSGDIMTSEAQAWGVNHVAGVCTISGGSYSVLAKQSKAAAAGNTQAYGVQNAASQTTNISDASFSVTGNNTSYSQNVYGLYISGTTNCTNSTFDIRSRINAYGIYGDGTSNVTSSGNVVSASAIVGDGAYGLYSNKSFSIDGDEINASSYGKTAYALSFGSSAVGDVLGGKFGALGTSDYGPINRTATVGKVLLKGGYYKTSTNLPIYKASGRTIFNVTQELPEYAEGYYYVIATENPSSYVCFIGDTGYESLESAIQYTNDNPSKSCVIVMTQSCTLPAGNYYLPSTASILIPYESGQNTIANRPTKHYTAEPIEENIRLTLASGVNLNVDGQIEVSAKMYCAEGVTSYVNGAYGCIEMKENSKIQLNNGAKLYAWGFVVGQGDIKVKGGAEVREMFQALDLPTVGVLFDDISSYQKLKHFPCSQYFIQNIEVPTTYYYNSRLITSMYIGYAKNAYGTDNIKLIGTPSSSTDNYLFQIVDNDESAWVRKEYNATKDRQVWTIGSKAQLGAMTLSISGVPVLGSITMDSKDYVLPLTSNMTINTVEGGQVELTQSMELLSGAEINVNKAASFTINAKDSKNGAVNFYVIDSDQNYYSTKYVNYSPSWPKATRPSRSTPDAAINISGGEIVVKGNLYTTDKAPSESKTGGANIYSNNDNAGTISFQKNAPAEGTLSYWVHGTGEKTKVIRPAQLKNANGTYASTAGTVANEAWGYMNGAWVKSYTNGCFEIIDDKVYAKPSEYVELANTQIGTNGLKEGVANADHTYTTVGDKLLICQDNCEWWEVEATATPGVFYCAKVGYEGYYEYVSNKWQLVKRNVTFYLNEEKTSSKVVSVNYMGVPDQSVIATNPTKATTAAATYTFYGWKSSVTETEYAWTATLEAAATDMFYTPVFTENARNYTITFNDANNNGAAKVEAAYGSRPQVVPSKPATAQYTYTFKDFTDGSGNHYATCNDLPVVTGTATYTANWMGITNVYTIIFKDGEQTLQTKIDQPYGTATAFAGVLPSKEADDEFAYVFDGWVSSQDGTKYANGSTPAVSGDVTYTAYYATTARYIITFANYDGTILQREATTAGEHPVYAGTPRRDADRDGYFRFDGWMDGDGVVYAVGAPLPAVSKKQTYTAQWTYVTTRFTVKFVNFDGNGGHWEAQFGEGETPSYDGATPLCKVSDKPAQYYYEFAGWTPAIVPVTEAATYTAQWSDKIPMKYTITFVYDGYGNSINKEYAYGAMPAYDTSAGDPTPRKDDEGEYSYTFNGWDKTFATVTGNTTYTAQFLQTQHQYTITFVKGNGEPNVEQHLYKGVTPVIADPTKATDAEWSYTFAGWNPAIGPVLYDATYTAQWSQTGVPYNVTFVDEDGSTILKDTETVAHAQKPTAPADPSKAPVGETFYKFDSWTMSTDGGANYAGSYTAATIPAVGTSNVIYKAVYTTIVPEALEIDGEDITPYESFATALSNVTNGATLKLMKDISRGSTTTTFNKNMTLDLNGKTLSTTSNVITVSADVTIMDSKTGGTISMNGSASSNIATIKLTSGTLTLQSGTIYGRNSKNNSSARAYPLNVNGGTFTMYGGKLEGYCDYKYAGGINQDANSQVNIYGGLIQATTATSNQNTYGIIQQNNSAKVIVTGGEIRLYASGSSGTVNTIYTYQGQNPVISGGKFYTQKGNNLSKSLTVSGGFYSTKTNVNAATNYEVYEIGSDPEYAVEKAEGYNFVVRLKRYDIKFVNYDGTELQSTKVEHGAMPEYIGETPQKDGYTFTGWDKEIVLATAAATYTAQFAKAVSSLIVDDETEYAINESTQFNDLTIKQNGSVTTSNDAKITVVNNLFLEATPDNNLGAVLSGDIQVQGNAYIDINMNGSGTMNKYYYYSFAVPFSVNVSGGVYRMDAGNAIAVEPGVGFLAYKYNEATRANSGAADNCWDAVSGGTFEPGVFYLILFSSNLSNTYRFQWNGNGSINNHNSIAVTTTGNDATNSGWHGVANNGLGYAKMSGEFSVMQALNSKDNVFEVFSSEQALAIGNPVFVQMPTGTISLSAPAPKAAAPQRVAAQTGIMNVRLTREGAEKHDDQIFFSASEDAENQYTLGKDVAKMFMGEGKVAQLWINAYGESLVANEAVLSNDAAEFPLGIFAPASGDYMLSISGNDNESIYLTYEGLPVWNLSMSDYPIHLSAGSNDGYSLVLRRAPQVTTEIDNVHDNTNGVQKFVMDNKLFIIRGEHVYDAQGKLMK